MRSKRERTADNVSPAPSKLSPVAYRRTSIPSIIPLSVATALGTSIPSTPRRAPLAPLDPQLPFNTPLDNQMTTSSSSSGSSQRTYALPEVPKDGEYSLETGRAYIGRHIINRTQEDDPDQNIQSSRKRSISGHGNSVRSLPYSHSRAAQQRRPSNTPSVSSSRRPSLPNTQYAHPTSQLYGDPSSFNLSSNTAPAFESPPYTTTPYLSNEDLYSGLSTFTFGAVHPLPSPQLSDSSEMVSPLTRLPSSSSADRTPRPSIASSTGSSRRVRAPKVMDPEEGDDEYDEDEDDTARGKTRSKMRAIDDGTRRPSLPTNVFPPAIITERPPPLPSTSYSGSPAQAEMSPGASSGQESGLDDFEVDEGDPAEFDTDVEFDLQRTHGGTADPPISDTASQHTFGVGGYSSYESSHERDSHEEGEDNISMSPVTFSRDPGPGQEDIDILCDVALPRSPTLPPRRGSVPWDIPGTAASRARDSVHAGREREDSAATVTARRASRSVDDNLNGSLLDLVIQPTSHLETRADFRNFEAQQSASSPTGPTEEENAQEAVGEQEFQYGEFDLNYILGSEGRKSWSSGRPSYIEPHNINETGSPSGLGASWDAGWLNARRPSIVTVNSGDDVFTRQVRRWDGVYDERRLDWSFRRESTDGRGPYRLSISSNAPGPDTRAHANTMAPGSQELWRQAYIGRFKVDRLRMPSDQPAKPPQQRLNVRHIIDPYSQGNTRGGPGSVIHKHSRAVAFSIFRNHSLFSRHARHPRVPMNTSASILLATKRVQEQYTSTRTTSKLNSHGLLEDVPRHPDGTTAYSPSTAVAPSMRSRPTTPPVPSTSRIEDSNSQRAAHSADGSSSDAQTESRQVSTSPPPVPPKPITHRTNLSVSTVNIGDSARAPEDTVRVTPSDSTQNSATTDHSSTMFSFSNTSRSLGHGDPMDIEDDEHEQSPPRTSHAEAFATVDSSYLEHVRGRSEPRHVDEPPHSLLGVVKRRLLGQGGSKSQASSSPLGPRESNYTPPWLTMAPRSKQEERERVIQNLNESFKDVGLLPTMRPGKNASAKNKRRKNASTNNIFEHVPTDSLYMLLPLWPGETDPSFTELREDPTRYIVRLEERQFLLVYYVPFDASESKKKGDSSKKRTRSIENRSSSSTAANNERLIALPTFRICAKLVSYADLRETGVRVPAYGLSITGSMTEAVQYLPPAFIRDQQLDDVVIGVCNARSAGMEFLPEGLKKLGLCMPSDAPAPPTRETDEIPEEIMLLTPIGRAAVEMAWLGCMAVTSFGTI